MKHFSTFQNKKLAYETFRTNMLHSHCIIKKGAAQKAESHKAERTKGRMGQKAELDIKPNGKKTEIS